MSGYYNGYTPYPTDILGQLRGNQFQQQQPGNFQSPGSDILWVQGESAARAYPVAPGKKLLLMDSENPVFYIKSADMNGMPFPLKKYRYTEEAMESTAPTIPPENNYVTRKELDEILKSLKQPEAVKEEKNNA